MSTKQQLLEILEENRGFAVSGEAVARSLNISRAAVSKAVRTLRDEGYLIHSATNRGYILDNSSDVVCTEALDKLLDDDLKGKLTVLNETESTNILAKKAAIDGCAAGTCFVALRQTGGKGRRGKAFFSPDGGLYISIVLRPELCAEDSVNITTCAAVAVCRAIETVCEKQTQIKWVNDVFYNGKKLCGILTEASADLESGGLEYAVLGIGINFCHRSADFPPELQNIATALYEQTPPDNLRTRLAAEVINNVWRLEKNPSAEDVLRQYKALSFILGKQIQVLTNPPKNAVAIDINNKGNLIVRYDNGDEGIINSGEVSILPVKR